MLVKEKKIEVRRSSSGNKQYLIIYGEVVMMVDLKCSHHREE